MNFRFGSTEGVPCQLSILIPFHDDRIVTADNKTTVISPEDTLRDGLTLLTSALLAIEDFNKRESSLAPDALKGIQDTSSCSIHFLPPKITDTRQSATVVRSTELDWRPEPGSTCSFVVGPGNNYAAEVVGQSVYGNGTLAISYGADADRLANDRISFPNLALANIKWEDYVRSLMQYVKSSGRQNVGVLLTPEDNLDVDNDDFVPMWTKASQDIEVPIKSLSRISYRSRSVFEERLQTLRDSRGVRTILVALHRDDELELLANVADSLGMLTKEYTWIFTEHFLSSRYVASYMARTDSSVSKLFERTEIFELLDGFSPYAEGGSSQLLQTEILSRGATLVETIQSIVDQTAGLEGLLVNQTILEEAFFSNIPVSGVSKLYDAILAAGLSACNGTASMEHLLGIEFDGVSGKLAFRTDSRSLISSETQFGVFSIQPSVTYDCNRCKEGNATFQAILIDRMVGGIVGPTIEDLQTLSPQIQTYGIVLAIFAMTFSFLCGLFVYKFRKDRIVTIGQPEFLGMVCVGSFIVAIPIILMSFDEGSGLTAPALDTFCTVEIWLKYLGILIVNMALFSKLYRVEKVTQLRRGRRITVKDVIKPFCGLFFAAFTVLIVWTAVERPVWKREFEIGFCYEVMYFGVAMDLIMIVAISLTLWWGHKTRDLPEDISDSKRVYYTLVAQFILLMLDIVFSVLTRAIQDNTYAYIVGVTYEGALSLTCCAYLIIPKMYYVYIKRKTGEMPPSLQRGTVRVTGIEVPTGASGISGHARYESKHSRALRASRSSRLSNNFTNSSAASANFGTQSSVEKSGLMESKEASESVPDPPLSINSPQIPRRATPPTVTPFSSPLETVLDSSMRNSSITRESESDLNKPPSQTTVTSEHVWVQSVEESKDSQAVNNDNDPEDVVSDDDLDLGSDEDLEDGHNA